MFRTRVLASRRTVEAFRNPKVQAWRYDTPKQDSGTNSGPLSVGTRGIVQFIPSTWASTERGTQPRIYCFEFT